MDNRNLYLVDLQGQLFWVFAVDQSEALKIVFEKEVNNHNDFEEVIVELVCNENDIINFK